MTQGGLATPPPAGALGKESPLYGVLVGDQVVQRHTLLSLSSLQRFLQHWREAAVLGYVLAPFGAQRPSPEHRGRVKTAGAGGALGSIPTGGAGRAIPEAPPTTPPRLDPAP